MPSILSSAASGMQHNATVLDIVGHNIANVSTDGFKAVRALAEGAPDAGAGVGRKGVAQTTLDRLLNGASARPGAPLHFTIQDNAFFAVRQPGGGTAYARLGALSVDAAGNIVATGGRLLEPPVVLPGGHTRPATDASGVISAVDPDGQQVEIGSISFFRFTNPEGLESLGEGLFAPTANSGPPVAGVPGDGELRELLPGTFEASNVELATEFTNMIIAQRAYQANVRAFRVGDEMLALATDLTQ